MKGFHNPILGSFVKGVLGFRAEVVSQDYGFFHWDRCNESDLVLEGMRMP